MAEGIPTPFDDGDLYDLLFEKLDYGLAYYLESARAAKGAILDLACGTGRVMLPCLKEGLDVDGLDLSPSMLGRLRQKADALGYKPRIVEGDMTSFRMERRYRLIVITFNAFAHALTTADQVSCLRCCRAHLEPGGMLAFDGCFPAAAAMHGPEDSRVLEFEIPHPVTGWPVRLYDTRRFDRVRQLQFSLNDIEMFDASGGLISSNRSETTVRWTFKGDLDSLLRAAGFASWEIFGGFDRKPLETETDGMLVEARA